MLPVASVVTKAFLTALLGRQNPYTITDNVNLVVLDVSVKDARGAYVSGLSKSNFEVFEERRPRPIATFSSVDDPVSIGLVVDNSGSMRLKRQQIATAGLAFAKESNSRDEFFVVNFNNVVHRGLPDAVAFTDNVNELRAALQYGQPAGQTALYDAIASSLRHLELSHFERRALIVVSDGRDNVSQTSLRQLMVLIEASRATLYTVGLYDQDDPDVNRAVLRKLAKATGGEFFEPYGLEDIVCVFDNVSRDIRSRYTIGFIPGQIDNPRKIRSVKVTVVGGTRKLKVRSRTHYRVVPVRDSAVEQIERKAEAREP